MSHLYLLALVGIVFYSSVEAHPLYRHERPQIDARELLKMLISSQQRQILNNLQPPQSIPRSAPTLKHHKSYSLDEIFFEIFLPEDRMNITEVIKYYNYSSVENHVYQTEDGYILQMQRIPCSRNVKSCESRPPVLLQHGFIDSSHTWVNNLPNESLGFILADQGFDVWLANSRGNTYSKAHNKYTPKEKEFWEFSWDDMAQYDLPATISYILQNTGRASLGYVGHSQGTEIAFARFSLNDALAKRINSVVALAPIAFLSNVESLLKTLAKHPELLDVVLTYVGHGEFLPTSKFMMWLAEMFCSGSVEAPLCSNIIFYIAGFDVSNLNETRLPVYMSHLPAGTSVRDLIHYCQGINSNNFQRYDFGKEGNIKHYNQPAPPQYDVSNFTIPLAMISGGNDTLSTPLDVQRLMKLLPNVKYQKFLDYYNHLDFVWGEDAGRVIYPDVIQFLKRYAAPHF